jgi:response regulator RpfG family c-di-GMP phosphodiesterase
MAEVDNPVARKNESFAGALEPHRGSAVRVLAVDDEPVCRKLLALMLCSPPFSCTIAGGGEEALVALQREPFDAVISDLQMPGMRAMSWSDKQLGSLARGAYLHDIGKLGVPDAILLKPGALTADEWKFMQRHAQIGFDTRQGHRVSRGRRRNRPRASRTLRWQWLSARPQG